MRFDLVIFDCDGVLVDGEASSDRIVSTLLRELGIEVSPEEVGLRTQGVSDRDMWVMFEQQSGKRIPPDTKRRYRKLDFAALRRTVAPISGVEAVLAHLVESARPICVASSGTKMKMRVTLSVTGLARYFGRNVFSATQVRHGKPAPDLFLLAAAQMGHVPGRCAVIEDSRNGVLAALAAGMTPFGYVVPGANQGLDDLQVKALADERTRCTLNAVRHLAAARLGWTLSRRCSREAAGFILQDA